MEAQVHNIEPKTEGQHDLIRCIAENIITFGIGPAGCGKTAISVGLGVQRLLREEVKKLIITRPTVGVDEDKQGGIGYLPGSMEEKMNPFIRPVRDELLKYLTVEEYNGLYAQEKIEILPLYYCRGRNFWNSYIVFDEAQNADHAQILAMTTRICKGTKMVITGDIEQHDRQYRDCDLATWVNEIIKEGNEIGICRLSRKDIQREPVVKRILNQWGKYEDSNSST